MKILIGMLVWNEEKVIKTTLASLLKQTLISKYKTEILIVANGCTDKTAKTAENFLKKNCNSPYKVISIPRPGKTPAWNDLIHKFSTPDDDYIIMMDGDIVIPDEKSMEILVMTLKEKASAVLAADIPIKDIHFRKNKSFKDKVSIMFSNLRKKAKGQICGQLYCAKSSFLRKVVIPEGIIVEDTFLKFMAVTDGLTTKQDDSKVIVVKNSWHVYEAYTGFKDYFKNQMRQTVSFTIWRIFKKEFIQRRLNSESAMQMCKRFEAKDTQWFRKSIKKRFTEKKFWYIYKGAVTIRFKRMEVLSLKQKILMFFPILGAWTLDLAVFIASNRKIRKGDLKNIWPDTNSNLKTFENA